MKIEYDQIEDTFDDTTHNRTMTEQAMVQGRGWLIRTTVNTPHHIAANVVFIADASASDRLFDPVVP
ncbi:MAG: hypothetical protein H6R26_3273 [Proteobacteria bacterium]|nr:hypothetical protein [Pseudomonadota bacterium]